MWHDMWVAGVPLSERVIRAVVVYAFAVIALRLAGKRELGQLSTFDLVVLLFLSNILQNSIIGNDLSVTGGIIGAATLLIVNHLVVRSIFFHERIEALIEGRPTMLVNHGVILRDNLRRELVSISELMVACHKQGVFSIEDVEEAMLEPDGSITVFGRAPSRGQMMDEAGRRLDAMQASLARIEATLAARAGG